MREIKQIPHKKEDKPYCCQLLSFIRLYRGNQEAQMTEREKELEELREIKEIIFGHILKSPTDEIPLEKIGESIQQAGYTKKHFPVEKLAKEIENLRYNIERIFNAYVEEDAIEYKEFNRRKKEIFESFNKIAELKED